MERLKAAMADVAQQIEGALDRLLPKGDGCERKLFDAMRYSTLNGGKRLRPFLVLQGAQMFNVAAENAQRVACAVEMIHCYSLVHDDLPAMDDDCLRRGKPTCHRKFDEATAILVGDALQALAFEVLGQPATHPDPAVRADLVVMLAKASGAHGMVGGQMFDLAAEGVTLNEAEVTRLQRLKTGALFNFAAVSGAVLGKASPQQQYALQAYAHNLGLAFQIADDLLDHEGTVERTGKAVGKDAAVGKATFVSILGADNARAQAASLADQAAAHLSIFGEKADHLKAVAQFVVTRTA